jgi:hypothetical protein
MRSTMEGLWMCLDSLRLLLLLPPTRQVATQMHAHCELQSPLDL